MAALVRQFSASELEGMRSTQDSGMLDQCYLLTYSEEGARDRYGIPVAQFIASDDLPCGLDVTARKEILDNAQVTLTDAVLRLPIDTPIDRVDRVVVTHRHGEELDEPEVYVVMGQPRRGASGLLLNLRALTFEDVGGEGPSGGPSGPS